MKQFTLLFILLSGLIFSCEDEKPRPPLDNLPKPLPEEVLVDESETTPNVAEVLDQNRPKPFPNDKKAKTPLEQARKTIATNFWIVNAYVATGDSKVENRKKQGRWYQFKEDGTFLVGQFNSTITEGTWSFDYGPDSGQLKLDAKKTEEDGLWNVMLSKDESLMILVGTPEYNTNGIQQRLENLIFIPKNRKEMGLKN